MFRLIIGVIISVFMLSLLRMIMSAISGEVGGRASKGGSSSKHSSSAGKQPPAQAPNLQGGELRKCPGCSTYHTVPNIAGRTAQGEVVHFCSTECREKYVAA